MNKTINYFFDNNTVNYTSYNNTEEKDNINYLLLFSPCIFIIICLFSIICYHHISLFIQENVEGFTIIIKKKIKKTYLINEKDMDLKDTCSICLDDLNEIDLEKGKINNIILKTECNHKFHKKCIKHNSIINCPICRKLLKFKSYCIINNIGESET